MQFVFERKEITISGLQVKSRFLEERVSVSLSGPAGSRLQPSCLCFFLVLFFPLYLPHSLHVWDTLLPDCLGMEGVGRITCVCSHSLPP